MREKQIARFWSLVDRSGECWEWKGRLSPSGYGRFDARGTDLTRHQRAHRVAWVLANGAIPDGLFVCHRCDNRACVRVEHLFLGSPKDNTMDAQSKGRLRSGPMNPASVRRGERATNARLTAADVVEIRRLALAGVPQSAIGDQFGIRQAQVSAIVAGRSWSHIADGVMPKCSAAEAGRRRRAA